MAGQDAQLLLKVGLDLTAFRQSLAGLGAASVGYSLPIKIKFDRGTLNTQLANLTAAIGKKKYTVELNIAGGLTGDQLKKIQDRLKTLKETEKVEIPVSVIAQASDKEIKKVVAGLNRSIKYSDALVNGKIRVPATIFSAITKKDVRTFTADAKKELKAQTQAVQQAKPAAIEIAVDDAKFTAFVNRLTKGPLAELHAAMQKAGIGMADAGAGGVTALKAAIISGIPQLTADVSKGIAQGLDPKLKENGRSGAKNLIDGFKEGTGIASPSKVFKQLGSFLVEGLEIGFTDRFKTFQSKALSQVRGFVSALRTELAKVENIAGRVGAGAMSAAPRGGKADLSPAGLLRPALPPIGMTTGSIARQAEAQARIAQADVRLSEPPRKINRGLLGQVARAADPSSLASAPRRGAGFRALPEVASQPGAGVEFSEMMRRFRKEIAALTTQPQKYEQLLNALPDRKITTDLTDAATRRSRAAEMPSFMSIQRQLGPGELEKQITGDVARYLKSIRIPNPWVGPTGDFQKFIGNISKSTKQLGSQPLLPMAGQTSAQGRLRSMLAGLPAIKSPSISKAGEESLSERGSYFLGKARRTLGLSGPYGQASVGASGVTGIAQPLLPPSKAVKLLPPGSSPTFQQIAAARTQIAYQRSAARNAAVLGGPSAPAGGGGGGGGGGLLTGGGGGPGSIPPSSGGGGAPSTQLGAGYYEVGKALNLVKSSYGQVQGFLNTKALPLTGAVTGLAGEFGNAIKQVLLFGTAYKALAFFTSLPGEAFEAAKGLATYRNQLKAVTSESQTFDQSLAFVDNLAQRFNTPLESARQGFIKLYASMEPAGFGQAEIENLFTGISKAAAAFGLSADKVDRVNYAFAQMASKGQIMSEELKGQLGDVLPGALGLFAKAAQMSIPEFTKAMEAGAFQGKAMQQVFENVAILMNSKFGPAAEGAAKTLQGATNQIQNNLKLMYESFVPIVDQLAAAFGPEINSLISDVSSTVKVLTSNFSKAGEGFNALSPRAQSFYTAIQTLKPSLMQAGAALVDLGGRFAALVPSIVQATATAISFASSPLGRGAIIAGVAIGGLTAALKLLEVTGLKAALKAVYGFISGLLAIPAATGVARVAIVGLKLALTGVFVGAILMGLDFVIGKLLGIGDAANKSKQEIQDLNRSLDVMAGAGDLEGTTKAYLEANTDLIKAKKDYAKASESLRKLKGTSPTLATLLGAQKTADEAYNKVLEATKQKQNVQSARDSAQKIKEKQNEESLKQTDKLAKIDFSGADKGAETQAKAAAKEAETRAKAQDQAANRQQQLAIDAANRQVALDQGSFDSRLRMSDAEYDHKRALQDTYFEREMSGLDSIEARQRKFQQDLQAIEDRRIDTIRKAEIDATKAVQEFRVANIKAEAASGGVVPTGPSKYVDRSILRKYLESEGFGRTSGDFTDKGHATYRHTINAMDYGILGGSDADALRKTIAMERKMRATGAFGDQLYGPERDPYGHGAGKGGGNIHLHLPTPDQKVLLTPKLANLFAEKGLLGGAASSSARPGAFAMGRREDKAGGQLAVEQQGVEIKALERLETIRRANKLAIEETITTIRRNIDTIFPVKEQQLENDLLELRNKLELKGMSRESIDMEVQKTKATKESARLLQALNEAIAKNDEALAKLKDKKIATPEDVKQMNLLTEQTAEYKLAIAGIPEQQRLFNEQLARTAELIAAQKTPQAIIASTAASLRTQFEEMTNLGTVATNVASTISGAFSTAFQGVVSGSMTAQQALSSFFKSVADAFLDMAAKMIAKWIEMQIIGLAQSLLGAGLGAGLGALGGGAGGGFGLGGAGSGTGGAVGSLGGAMSPTTSLPSFSSSFGSFSGGGFGVAGFAEGGIPPIGVPSLVGEQGPELFVPRTAGTVIPADTTAAAMARYQRQDSSSAPSAMEGIPAAAQGIPILSMSFETTQFMGQDWVSKDQLVAAMAATEKRATAAGAKAGAQQVATKMRTSPAFRRQVGV